MRVLVTGSAGHLGEALVRTLGARGHVVSGLDRLPSPFTHHVGSIVDSEFVDRCMRDIEVVLHTATLHKPHVATHSRRAFVDTNITGTLNILEAAAASGVSGVVYTSTTSTFGDAMRPGESESAVWVTEDLWPAPKNIYGVTKLAAEELCRLFHATHGLSCVVLRTSRFFREIDDDAQLRERYDDLNLKTNEYLYRRLDLADAVDAHILAAERAAAIGFGRYVVSATTPFEPEHLGLLRSEAPAVVRGLFPDCEAEFDRRGWAILPGIDRVYVNRRAREELGWSPRYDFRCVLDRLKRSEDVFSRLSREVGTKGYHSQSQSRSFEHGPYPVERGG